MARTGAGRVLLVDDNSLLLLALRRGLELGGYEIETANDGLLALERAATFRPDVAMIDIAIPLINGWEVARRIRRVSSLTSTKLIAMSGLGEPAHRERSLASGFAEHLTKPVGLALITRVVAESMS